jgi:hypothetical protein
MNEAMARKDRDLRCNNSGSAAVCNSRRPGVSRLHAVHESKTPTNFEDITLPFSALPDRKTGPRMALARLLSAETPHGEKSYEHD